MQNEMRNRFVELVQDALFQHAHYVGKERRRALEAETEADHSEIYESIKTLHEYVADYLIENGVVVPPCKVGDEIWVVEEDDITCYMFLAKSKGCVIATSWINDYDLDETIEYHIAETQDNLDTDLVVFPDEYCFATREEAEQALKGGVE